jgi:hypothetical protein
MPNIPKEFATVFWNAVKETPGQMFAPYIAAWKAVVKNSTPARPHVELDRSQQNQTAKPAV